MFGIVTKGTLRDFEEQLLTKIQLLLQTNNPKHQGTSETEDIETLLANTNSVEELKRLQMKLKLKRGIMNEYNRHVSMIGNNYAKNKDIEPDIEDMSEEDKLQQLSGLTTVFKNYWDKIPSPLKAGINKEAMKHTGGKTVDEILNSSDMIQGLVTTGITAGGQLINQKLQEKPKTTGLLPEELPYNPNPPPKT